MRPTLLLDLDGTIVDSVPDLTAALNRLMAARGLPGFSTQDTAAMVGDGVQRLVERAFAARGRSPDREAVAEYIADYNKNFAVATRLYPGVQPTLAGMLRAGWQLAVCTNKLEAPARALLDTLGLATMFAAIGGGDSFSVRKPDPRHLLATLQAAGGVVDLAVMAGDHSNDVAAAHSAGVPCIFAKWGYGPPAMAAAADRVATRFADLPAVAQSLLPVSAARCAGRT